MRGQQEVGLSLNGRFSHQYPLLVSRRNCRLATDLAEHPAAPTNLRIRDLSPKCMPKHYGVTRGNRREHWRWP